MLFSLDLSEETDSESWRKTMVYEDPLHIPITNVKKIYKNLIHSNLNKYPKDPEEA